MFRHSVLLGGVLVLTVSLASAQSPRGPGRGGFGGPGGMGGSSVLLLNIPEVQKEIGVTEAQQKQVDEIVKELQEQARASFGGRGGGDGQSKEDRKKRSEEGRAKAEENAKKSEEKLAKVLDAKQMERLNQLRLQRDGVTALGRTEIAKQLGLSEEQQKKVREIQDAARPEGRGGPPDGDREEFFKKMREKREKAQTDILAVLTTEQKTKWTAMQGKEFKFPESATRFGGGGGPGGDGKKEEKKRPERKKEI